MAEKIITSVFHVESEAYQAFSEIKQRAFSNEYIISQAAIVTAENGKITAKDWMDTGVDSMNDRRMGGLLGAMIGIFGGPIGMLLGGAWGHLAGSIKDTNDIAENASIFERVSGQLMEGETALIALVQENGNEFEQVLQKFHTNTIAEDAAVIAEEIEQAQQLQLQMEKEAKKQLREEKQAARKEKIEEQRKKLKEQFEAMKANKKEGKVD